MFFCINPTKSVFEMVILRFLKVWPQPSFIYRWTELYRTQEKHLNIMHSFTDRVSSIIVCPLRSTASVLCIRVLSGFFDTFYHYVVYVSIINFSLILLLFRAQTVFFFLRIISVFSLAFLFNIQNYWFSINRFLMQKSLNI